jgi:hypothetical protein
MPPRAPDPHNLRSMSQRSAPIIGVDRECLGCGYNLRGLRVGAPCPECGMPSDAPEGIDDPLSQMPYRVILAFIRGCWVASICIGAMMGVVIADRWGAWDRSISMMVLAVVAFLWVGAVLWLTPAFSLPQAVVRGFSRVSRLRRIARLSQLGWVIAAAAEALLLAQPNGSAGLRAMLTLAEWLAFAGGITGIVLLSILLERLSDWARDADAERMFNWATWGLPIATLMMLIDVSHPLLSLIVFLAWLVLVCTFPAGLLSLSKSVTLSLLHAKEHQDRIKRRDERTRQYHARVGQTVGKMDEIQAKRAGNQR